MQARAVGAHFPDTESGPGVLAEVEDHLPGIERQADLADEALAARHVGGPYDGPLQSCAKVVDIDAVVRKEPVGTGAAVDVRVVVIRRVGLAFNEDDLFEAQLIGPDGRPGRSRAVCGRRGHLARNGGPRHSRALPAIAIVNQPSRAEATHGILAAWHIGYFLHQRSD